MPCLIRLALLIVVALAGHTRVLGSDATGAAKRTNLVIILADDLGYGDLGCYGCPDIRTPVLDRMTREGTASPAVTPPVRYARQHASRCSRVSTNNGWAIHTKTTWEAAFRDLMPGYILVWLFP